MVIWRALVIHRVEGVQGLAENQGLCLGKALRREELVALQNSTKIRDTQCLQHI